MTVSLAGCVITFGSGRRSKGKEKKNKKTGVRERTERS